MKFLVDLDGVLSATGRHILSSIQAAHSDVRANFDAMSDYYLEKSFPGVVTEAMVHEQFNRPVFWETIPALPGVYGFMKSLAKLGEVHIVTARSQDFIRDMSRITETWLNAHGIVYDRLVFCHANDKAEYALKNEIDFAIEDRLDNAISISEHCPVALIDWPYNKLDIPDAQIMRCLDYDTVLNFAKFICASITISESEVSYTASPDSVLDTAYNAVHGDRGVDYGNPIHDFSRTAEMWNGYLGDVLARGIGPEDVGLMMVMVKLSRARNDILHNRKIKTDNLVDGAGYFETVHMVNEYEPPPLEPGLDASLKV